MPQYIDAYFLIPSRSPLLVRRFLDKFLPQRERSAEDYHFPSVDPKEGDITFPDAFDAIAYMEERPDIAHAIYWSNTNPEDPIHHGMVFLTDDGKMILGVSIPGDDPEYEYAIAIYREIKSFTGAELACMTVEEPPPDNEAEFRVFCKERFQPGEDVMQKEPDEDTREEEPFSRQSWFLVLYLLIEILLLILTVIELFTRSFELHLFDSYIMLLIPMSIIVGLVSILSKAVSYDKGSISKTELKRTILLSLLIAVMPCLFYWLVFASGHC